MSLRDGTPEDVAALAELGVTELVLVDSPPADPAAAEGWVGQLARRWLVGPAAPV